MYIIRIYINTYYIRVIYVLYTYYIRIISESDVKVRRRKDRANVQRNGLRFF